LYGLCELMLLSYVEASVRRPAIRAGRAKRRSCRECFLLGLKREDTHVVELLGVFFALPLPLIFCSPLLL
jgi:hypothetical protein